VAPSKFKNLALDPWRNKKGRPKQKSSFSIQSFRKQEQEIGEREGVHSGCRSLQPIPLTFSIPGPIVNNYHGSLYSVSLANDDDDFVPLHCHLLCNDHGINN
jgi:hypothetical protein